MQWLPNPFNAGQYRVGVQPINLGGIMSRTYKTDPFRVKLSKPECSKLKVVEDHDHRFGLECDLPENSLHEGFTRCTWEWEWTGINVCCCNLCSKYAYEKSPSKRERNKGKKYVRSFEKEY
jgi:hypothetical protein